MNAERLGVVVLAYGDGGRHLELIAELLAEGLPASALLVVHNPARPGEAPPPGGGCEVVQTGRNLGYAGGMNVGIEIVARRDVDHLLLLTHDARLRRGSLAKLLDAAAAHPGFGVLAPALVLAGTDAPFSFGGITRSTGSNGHILKPPAGAHGGIFDCDWVDGGTMLMRRDALDRAGGFDERFWGYCEEAELCLRIRRSGASVGVVLDAVAEQDPGGAKRPGPWAYLLIRNQTEYARKAVGVRGVIWLTLRGVLLIGFELLRAAARAAHLRGGDAGEPFAIAIGTARGSLDFFRRRWGPPPAGLPGMGDLRNA